ncbi:MAG: MarR family winged helix-turn-helix transcriptional regulator [Steroidobacterales bacterium]
MNRLRNLGFLLKGVSRLSSKNFERHARALGLSLSQCKVLVYLSRSEGVSQTRLAELTETDPMTLVRILDGMEQDKWIERRPDPSDRRAHRLYLDDAAKPVLTRIWKIADRARDEALAGLGAVDRERLIDLLEHIQKNLSAIESGDKSAAIDKGPPNPQRRNA